MVTHYINLTVDSFDVPPIIHCPQNDTGRALECTIVDYSPPYNSTVQFAARRANGTFVLLSCSRVGDNTFRVELDNGILSYDGVVPGQIQITYNTEIIKTFKMIILVDRSVDADGVDPSEEELNFMEQLQAMMPIYLTQEEYDLLVSTHTVEYNREYRIIASYTPED